MTPTRLDVNDSAVVILTLSTYSCVFIFALCAGSKLDLRSLLEELKEVTDWFRLGVWLGINHTVLTTIEKNYEHDGERCKIEMLEHWLKNFNASWSEMISALEAIDRRNLAIQLREKYNIPQTGTGTQQHRISSKTPAQK